MIPTTNTDNQLTGSLGGTRTAMSVDLSNLSHIMTVLTDLYSDPELAVIREYSTNALDSQTMAGVKRPIEVSLPTPLRQTFEVRDFGEGMSPAEITEVYGSYGSSTKRDRNDANGCLGLGSKSALTYTNMFTVRAVKNGVLTECAIYRDEFGAGSIEVVDTKATDEVNGVTIIIPTSANSTFEEKAKDFYSVWDKGTVLVDGVQPFHVTDVPFHLWVNDKTLVVPSQGNSRSSTDFVVMGGVSYPTSSDRWSNHKSYFFAEMNGGADGNAEVDFVPSREALNMNDKTSAVVEAFEDSVSTNRIALHAQAIVDKCATIDEAVTTANNYAYCGNYRGFSWGGERLVSQFSIQSHENMRRFNHLATDAPSMNEKVTMLHTSQKDRYVWITKRPAGASFTFKMKAKIRKYALTLTNDPIFILSEPIVHPQFANMKTVTWAKLDKIVVPKAVRGSAGAPKQIPEYRFSFEGGGGFYKDSLPTDPNVRFVYVNSRDVSYVHRNHTSEDKNLCIVAVSESREARFLRDHPNAISFSAWQAEQAAKQPELTDLEQEFLALDRQHRAAVVKYADQINDPKIKEFAKVNVKRVETIREQWYTWGKRKKDFDDYIEVTYPLANFYSYAAQTIAYINSLQEVI